MNMNTKADRDFLANIDAQLKAAGLPTYSDVVDALNQVMDGEQRHDMISMGFTKADGDDVFDVVEAARKVL